ncbi:cytochrome c oxidase accessory protein CcoG [Pseudomonas sp. CCI3.2]|uniref:cytochrome c oxidase accessory protein CcoG n=2 Tax=Pseudomonas TaxID=286 RepID=UPI002AC98715|nr:MULTISPECIES: cytochrome c oxidase accessory protein CcoG [unclassified Pseudomonas]MEB0080257.1 cytochrome c oxidase accessory protein CcoG [Pseudomonas sp. MH10out]MEB0103050.1 cytochrome c oxidase accessory protein CcoG [Pseudomonas sp. CCI3.2]MEB0129515.1 cytochrome c oxidase accessory protein CcoG [Pseudomonas sp. CCI2.4]MEB0157335.1 cytochrome c oxidase accessory protein CcoG [Pseudomonas sp. AH2 (2023)]MEB0166553.1 cytochrome c oxidase accessory protein CcoG [Pseudomonas sp. CCC4.4]
MSNQIPVHNVTPPSKNDTHSVDLYASRGTIYTRAFTGLFRNLRMAGGAGLFLLYFGTVWLNWGGHQAVWWNLPERKFYIFGATFWPQDFILLSGILIVSAFGLFFITVFAGRIWCGYTCPQSVWTWIFMWCEKVTEGDRNQRIKLDKAPMSANKLLRKASKHSLWLLIGFVTGLTFVGYFAPIRELTIEFFTGQAEGWSYFWVGFFTLATYGNAGWLREQVCIYMCPYARFQSVMFDKDTLIVSYDPRRGEKRGTRKKDVDYKAQGLGDCIDCTMCVQVCPTGIDIRDGLQFECIGCAACIDACDTIMDKMNYPRGLISYTTEHNLSGQKTNKVRPRLIGYAVVLLIMMGLLASAFFMRSLVGFDVSKDRVLYRENAEGRIENVYSLKVMNKDQIDHNYVLDASGLPDLKVQGRREFKVAAGEIFTMPFELSSAPELLPSSTNEVVFTLKDADNSGTQVQAKSRFIGPQIR